MVAINETQQNNETSNENEANNDDFNASFNTISLQATHPLYLHPSDHPGQVLVTTTFNGDNFNEWKRSMTLALSAKNKLGFVTGKYKAPGINSPYSDHWQRCNDMIITWILNSIVPEIRSSLVYVTSASEIWNDLQVRFTQNNGPKLFELKKELSALVQENLSISTYYTKFKKLYDDLVSVSNAPKCSCVCTCKAKLEIEQYEEVMKVTQFLMGLNDNFTNIRGQLLMMNPMPKLVQVLGLLQQDERQRSYSAVNTSIPESAVLMSKQVSGSRFFRKDNKNTGFVDYKSAKFAGNKGTMECSYCHGTNHTKERCFHLIGFPPRNKNAFNNFSRVPTTIILFFCTLSSIFVNSIAVDTIRAYQTIKDGETIVSTGGEFELGFFSPGRSANRYLGIWYKRISNGTVVWVANRDTPLINNAGVVRVNDQGITLQLDGRIIWSTNTTVSMKNPVVQLLDSGNLVVRDDDHEIKNAGNFIWQSFDYPVDTLLPGMKYGIDLVSGLETYSTAWKSVDDPSRGSFSKRLDPNGFPQYFLLKGSEKWSRSGPWIGGQFSGYPKGNPNNGIYIDQFVFNEREIYYKFDLVNKTSAVIRFTLTPNGEIKLLVWNYQDQIWKVYVTLTVSDCDHYGFCGANGICNINSSPRCECMKGFIPQFPEKWKEIDWSSGCVRKKKLDCGAETGFIKYSGVKLPDTEHSWYDMRIDLQECQRMCLKSCSCTAYANADIKSGCILWFDDLTDITGYTDYGQDLYVRMPKSELADSRRPRAKRHIWIVLVPTVLALIFLYIFRKKKQREDENLKFSSEGVSLNNIRSDEWELPLVEFKRILHATNNFSQDNKLGEGGFGPVYKGILDDGQEIAVKRLSKNSDQGLDEFINEVSCIAKLQHRNLVTLLGCCTEKGERILIYEYMANKSLDSFIFDEEITKSVNWVERYNIINGIARGLLYLHQDSKLRIIHRDLKASNILLDHEMNPKISDFGLARCFKGSQTAANTSRIVGTYGYMSPEYAIDGQFSIKSDVYSFGVLLIEIVSGKKNRLFSHPDHSLNLLGHAWKSYNEDMLLGVIDEVILESSNLMQVFRVIQIGLLCVQEDPGDRPVMSEVVLMLSSNMKLQHPKKPGFFMDRKLQETEYLLRKPEFSSVNDLTITSVLPRQ